MFRFSSSLLWYSWWTQSGQQFTLIFGKNKVCLVLSENERNREKQKQTIFELRKKNTMGIIL